MSTKRFPDQFFFIDKEGNVASGHHEGSNIVRDDRKVPPTVMHRLTGNPEGFYTATGKGLHGTKDIEPGQNQDAAYRRQGLKPPALPGDTVASGLTGRAAFETSTIGTDAPSAERDKPNADPFSNTITGAPSVGPTGSGQWAAGATGSQAAAATGDRTYTVDAHGNVKATDGGKVPSEVSVQLKGQAQGTYSFNAKSGLAAPQGGSSPDPYASNTDKTLASVGAGGITAGISGGSIDPNAPLGLTNDPGYLAGKDPTYVAPMWINGLGPAAATPGAPTGQGTGSIGALGGSHPGYTPPPDTRPHSFSDPGKLFYRQSDVWAIASNVGDIPNIQRQLVAAGLIDASKLTQGIWTADEAAAMSTVMTEANLHGVTWDKMLAYDAQHPGTITAKVTSPLDVMSLAKAVIEPTIHRPLSPDELQRFQQAYQKMELTNQQQAQQDAQQIGGATVQTQAPSGQAFAQSYAQENFGAETHAANYAGVISHLHSLLTGSG